MPGSVLAAVLLLAAMTPGFAFHQAVRRYSPKDARTSTTEVVELFSVGALATGTGLLITLLLAEVCPFLVPIDAVVGASADFRSRPWSWVVGVIVVMTLSMALSTGAGVYAGKRSPQRTGAGLREGTIALRAFTDRDPDGNGRKPYLAVELSDGRLVEGYVRYVSADTDPTRRDLVLQGPMAWTGPGEIPRTASPATFVFVPGALVRVVHISHPPPQPATGPDAPRPSDPSAGTA